MSDERVIEYLRSRARVEPPIDIIDSVMAGVAAAPVARRSWFAMPVPVALGAAVVVALVVIGVAMLTSQQVGPPPGPAPDCESDPAGLVEYAMAQLTNSPGYRWTETEELWGFDPAFPVSASDPHYAFSGYTAEGAFIAPDRMRAVTIDQDDPQLLTGIGGFPEVIVIGGHTYGHMPGGFIGQDGEQPDTEWQEVPAESDANRLANAFPYGDAISNEPIPPEAYSTDPIELSWQVPGEGGCLVWWSPQRGPEAPPEEPSPIITLRVDDDGRVLGGAYEYVRPELPDEQRRGDYRWRFSVVYEVPDDSEIQPPEGPIYTYTPTAP
jgi:hypothetical protein